MKHTALGRFKHEAATIRIAPSGHVVAYSGDDERFDYVYKFVSRRTYDDSGTSAARRRNMTLLSEGDLFVAQFTGDSPVSEITGTGALPTDGAFDGSGTWLPLVQDGQSRVPGMSVAEVLVFTRLAGDAVGATKMDRPEDVEVNPTTGHVYTALTNNTQRGIAGTGRRAPVDEANPRTGNRDGYVLELVEADNDPTRTTFSWNLLLVCGPANTAGAYFGGYQGPVSPISCPDNVAFDSAGNLWISTDGQPGTIQLADALHKVTLTGPERGKVEQFLAVPRDAETCGPVIHDRDDMVFVCVQHPGENGTWAAQRSYFPDYLTPGARPTAPGAARGRRSPRSTAPDRARARALGMFADQRRIPRTPAADPVDGSARRAMTSRSRAGQHLRTLAPMKRSRQCLVAPPPPSSLGCCSAGSRCPSPRAGTKAGSGFPTGVPRRSSPSTSTAPARWSGPARKVRAGRSTGSGQQDADHGLRAGPGRARRQPGAPRGPAPRLTHGWGEMTVDGRGTPTSTRSTSTSPTSTPSCERAGAGQDRAGHPRRGCP